MKTNLNTNAVDEEASTSWPKASWEAKNHPLIKKMRENGAEVVAADNHEDHELSYPDRFHITNGRMVMIAPPGRSFPYRSWNPHDANAIQCLSLCDQYAEKVQKEREDRLERPCVYTPLTNAGFNPSQPRDENGRWTKNIGVTGDNPEKVKKVKDALDRLSQTERGAKMLSYLKSTRHVIRVTDDYGTPTTDAEKGEIKVNPNLIIEAHDTNGNAVNSSLERILVHEISHLLRNGEDGAVQDENKVAKQLGENWERKRSDKDRIVDEKK